MSVEDGFPKTHPGWTGAFTRHQCKEAEYENGARIKKVWEEKGDATLLGTQGTVLGSLSAPRAGVAYFVEWDNRPRYAVLVVAKKIGRL